MQSESLPPEAPTRWTNGWMGYADGLGRKRSSWHAGSSSRTHHGRIRSRNDWSCLRTRIRADLAVARVEPPGKALGRIGVRLQRFPRSRRYPRCGSLTCKAASRHCSAAGCHRSLGPRDGWNRVGLPTPCEAIGCFGGSGTNDGDRRARHGRNMRKLAFVVKGTQGNEDAVNTDWRAEFEAAAERPLDLRLKYALIHTYKPVLDDEPYRSFETTRDYRNWCNAHLPKWLGYGTD